MPSFDRKKRGVDAEIRVGRVECRMVVGAIENGNVQLGRVLRVAIMDRGGWVDGVRISFVRAMSIGARMTPATPAADMATPSEARGDGEDRMSRPPV